MKPFPVLAFLLALPAHADPGTRRNAVVDVVQRVSPAVVYIGTEQIVETRFRGSDDPFAPFFEDFLGGRRQRQAVQSLGSGVIIDSGGTIVTNDHVIRGASAIHVVLADGRQLDAEVTGADSDNDLAVLKVQAKGPLPAAKLAAGNDLMIGETAIAIGSPFGLSKTVTVGVVSAIGRGFKANGRFYNDFVQTDASINPGNSGGPLLNIDGEIIGINSAIFQGAQGIGFAIPADKVRRIVAELTRFGKVRPAWVGVEAQPLTPDVAGQLGWDKTYGALVASVDPGSPAEKAGLARGDLVTEVDGTRVADAEDFDVRMRGYTAKASIQLTVFRGRRQETLTVVPVEFPSRLGDMLGWDRLGLKLKPQNGGLVISAVRRGSEAARIGLEAGDGVLKINSQPLRSVDTWRDALISARTSKSVVLLVQRGRQGYYITLPF